MKGGKKEPAPVPKNAIAKPKNRRDDCARADAQGAVANETPKTRQRFMNKPHESVVKPAQPAAATARRIPACLGSGTSDGAQTQW
jgi:hypothetical protein